MIETQNITAVAQEELAGSEGLFLVEVKALAGDEFEVFIDSDAPGGEGRARGVTVEDCVKLTKAIESHFDRDTEDFSLTVSSAGIGQPLKVLRQYRKLVSEKVEIVLKSGTKLIATLEGIETGGAKGAGTEPGSKTGANAAKELEGARLTLSYPEKQKAEGKKRPETVVVTQTLPLTEIKTTKEHIDFR